MPQEKLRGIIIKAKPVHESLHLDTFLENGEFGLYTIPGILKSNKRSSFHYSPGAVYQFIFHRAATARLIPRSAELVFSPFADSQEYARLAAVAEIIQTAEYIRPGPESAEFFELMAMAVQKLPRETRELDTHIDSYYQGFLEILGLAAVPEADLIYVAYDLQSGFLTAKELSERPASDFLLPWPWTGAEARKTIRQFLAAI